MKIWTAQEDTLLRSFYLTLNASEIATLLNRSRSSVIHRANRLKIYGNPIVKHLRRNPYLHLRKTELAYIAGIIDGEGSICWGYYNAKSNNNKPVLRLSIDVTNTDLNMLQWFLSKLDGSICEDKRSLKPYTGGYRHMKPSYKWELSGITRAQYLLKLLLPYLIIKKIKAENALKLKLKRTSGAFISKGTQEELQLKYI